MEENELENIDQIGQEETNIYQQTETTEEENKTENIEDKQNNQLDNISQSEDKEDKTLNLGKFKDVNSLLTAYNNLQAEFTKKCQKLSELSKSCDNNANALPQNNWEEKVNNFLSKNQEAKPYSKEISELLMNNTDLLNSENALDKAWTKVLMNNVDTLKQKMQDKNYILERIEDDDELKQTVINDYVSKIKTKQSPTLMDSQSAAFAISKVDKALSLEEASSLVKAMLK